MYQTLSQPLKVFKLEQTDARVQVSVSSKLCLEQRSFVTLAGLAAQYLNTRQLQIVQVVMDVLHPEKVVW